MKRILLLVPALASLAYGAYFGIYNPSPVSAAAPNGCCSGTAGQCGANQFCATSIAGLAPCSPDFAGYCVSLGSGGGGKE